MGDCPHAMWTMAKRSRCKTERLEEDRGKTYPTTGGAGSARRDELSRNRPNARGNHMNVTTELDAHCRKPSCGCGHVICYRGWIDTDQTTPCQFCRPQLHERWLMACQARQKGYPVEAVHRILSGTKPR